jgi:predicted amidohydrolase YtcJ
LEVEAIKKRSVLFNGNIIKMTKEKDYCSALIIEDEKIVDLGSDEEILNKAWDEDRIIDLNKKTILPGFIDSHLHLMSTIINEISLNFERATCIEEVLQMISDKAKGLSKGSLLYGNRLSEFTLKERSLPTRQDIDKVAADVAVIISSIEFHTVVLNSYAMHLFNIPFTSNSFEKDICNNFTGKIRNRGSFIARRKMFAMMSDEDHLRGIDSAVQKIISKGVTTTVTMESGSLFHEKHIRLIKDNLRRFPFDVEIFYSTTDIKRAIQYDLTRIGGDIFLDGSFRSQNAAIYQPYSDDLNNYGHLFFTQEELKEFMGQAHSLGLQISVHAVGERAIDMLLDCYEQILRDSNVFDYRHRIEHFELPTTNQIKRVRELGLILAMHPTYEYFFRGKGDMYDTRLGMERSLKTNPFKEILDNDIVVIGCSDSDVMPVDPLLGVHSAVNHPNIYSRVSVFDALKMYTKNGAYSLFDENTKGTIGKGKLADLIILDKDPLKTDKDKIKYINILNTIKGGKSIYTAAGGIDL